MNLSSSLFDIGHYGLTKQKRKKMKKIYAYIFTFIMAVSSAYAENITVLTAGKPGGSFFARANMYKDVLTKMGYTVNLENIGDATEATKYLIKAKNELVIMPYSANQVPRTGLDISKNNFVLVEYSSPNYWCQSNESVGKNKLKVGMGHHLPTASSEALFEKLGIEVVFLKYKNSGAVYNALTSGDVDATFTSQGPSMKIVKNGQGTCFAQTQKGTINGVPSIFDIVKDKKLPYLVDVTLVISNQPSDKLRNTLLEVNKDALFTEWRAKRGDAEITDRDVKEELEMAVQSATVWKQAKE